MTQDDEQREYEQRLRRRLDILRKEIEAGNISIASDLKVIESLKAVRYGSDGEIDLATVDSSVRSLALATEAINHRVESKKSISLLDLQRGYFEFFEKHFGRFYNQMQTAGVTPFQFGSGIARDPEGVRVFTRPFQMCSPGPKDFGRKLTRSLTSMRKILMA